MIKFHYHRARTPVRRLGIEKGDRLCHVYSDDSLEELEAWGRRHDLKPEWIHEGSIPHFDAFGDRLAWCGSGVSGREFAEDIRRWRRLHGRAGDVEDEAGDVDDQGEGGR